MIIDIPYYEDLSRISNSNIGTFIKYGPAALKKQLSNEAENLSAKYLEKGTMIHMYLLQKEDFWKEYCILDFSIPKVKQQKSLCDLYFTGKKVDPFISEEELLLSAYNGSYSNSKTDAVKLAEAKELLELNSNYLEYLASGETKKVITFADLQMLKTVETNVKEHKLANTLLFNVPDTTESYNEFHINWSFPRVYHDYVLLCKSLIDRCLIDHTTKKITLIDIKTTVDVQNFAHSVEEFDYTRQLAYYWLAIQWYFINELHINPFDEGYSFDTYIIAIQNNKDYNVRVFKFKPESVESRLDTINNAISEISWHFKNDLWQWNKEYYEGDGAEQINV